MNMKVHQTLVWLNLLSFRTKDLAAPTIGIQSAANHNTLLRHFDTSVPTVPAAWECENWEDLSVQCRPGWYGKESRAAVLPGADKHLRPHSPKTTAIFEYSKLYYICITTPYCYSRPLSLPPISHCKLLFYSAPVLGYLAVATALGNTGSTYGTADSLVYSWKEGTLV